MTGSVDAYLVWDSIYSKTVLDNVLINDPGEFFRAGIPTTVAQTVYKMSAPANAAELVQSFDGYRQVAQDLEEQMKMMILHYFPGYTLAELDKCTFNTLMRLFAGIEFLITSQETRTSGQPFQFSSPQEQQAAQNGTISNRELAQHNRVITRG